MVTQLGVFWLGTVALLVDYVGLSKADNMRTTIVSLGFGLVFWAAFALSASGYRIYTDAGTEFTVQSAPLMWIGYLGIMGTFVLLVESVLRAYREST